MGRIKRHDVKLSYEEEGKQYGRLTIVYTYVVEHSYGKLRHALCLCSCGKTKDIVYRQLNSGQTSSCGCLQKEVLGKRNHDNRKHGYRNTPIYYVWGSMKERILNKNNHAYKHYGGRGIGVEPRWIDKEKGFINFLADMGEIPKGYTLDRIDVNKGYYKDNCRWTTWTQQGNNRRNNRLITIDNTTKTISEWCNTYNLNKPAVYKRISKGWDLVEAIMIPVRSNKKRSKDE